MKDGPTISKVAALMGDPARANILVALMDGRARTVTELAQEAGVTKQTASGHLTKLDQAGLTATERQGRHRYIRLSGPDVAQVLEGLMSLAQRTGAVPVRTGPRDAQLRRARVCYDHLAGERAVELFEQLVARQLITADGGGVEVTEAGRVFFNAAGIDIEQLERQRRCVSRTCLDWSERRNHLAGSLGAAVFQKLIETGWAKRGSGRVVQLAPDGIERLLSGGAS
ncbi:MAG: helix-turn-helix transcriptional regulator [Brevundimonas sp.]|jgi:DNA-binding transcriptional ArsR family regulator|nr:helix-turn-helix transcriptional regulator [Brevundimonas sp.]